MSDHRTPEWMAEFERGKESALKLYDPPSSLSRSEKVAALVASDRKILAESAPWPNDPYRHGLRVGISELREWVTL